MRQHRSTQDTRHLDRQELVTRRKRFWSRALETGRIIELDDRSPAQALGPILDPVALVHDLQEDQ